MTSARRRSGDYVSAELDRQADQDLARGDWPSLRGREMPKPPWPDPDNPVLNFLIEKALEDLASGEDPRLVITHLAVHAWMESGVEHYDMGQRHARGLAGSD